MSNPFGDVDTNIGANEDEYAGGTEKYIRIQYNIGDEVRGQAFPGYFFIPGDVAPPELAEQGFGTPWELTTGQIGDDQNAEMWRCDFLPPHVLLDARRAKSYYVISEKKTYRFPWEVSKDDCLHPEDNYSLPKKTSGVDTNFDLHLLLLLVDHMHLGPFYLTLPGRGSARQKMFDNNLHNEEYGNQSFPWGISQVLNKTRLDAKNFGKEQSPPWNVKFKQFGQWIGVAVPMTNEDGSPYIVQYGSTKTSPVNPFQYVVQSEGEKYLDMISHRCVFSKSNQESGLYARVAELQDDIAEWKAEWGAEALLGERQATLLSRAGALIKPEEEEEEDLPF